MPGPRRPSGLVVGPLPLRTAVLPSCGTMTTRALTDSEITLLDEALVKRGRFRDRALLVMATDTGFRISELLSLTWPQLLSATGEIRQDVTIERAQLKGGAGPRRKVIRSRRVPLSERVRGAIADALGTYGSVPQGPVFKSRIGENRPITRIFVKSVSMPAGSVFIRPESALPSGCTRRRSSIS